MMTIKSRNFDRENNFPFVNTYLCPSQPNPAPAGRSVCDRFRRRSCRSRRLWRFSACELST
nr:MAG TPA: hypothetical protein [Inoviridae sp.]